MSPWSAPLRATDQPAPAEGSARESISIPAEGLGAPRSSGPFDDPWIVAHYEDWYASPFGVLAHEVELAFLEDLLSSVPRSGSLLEIGCGTAHFGTALARLGYTVSGVDLSQSMLQRAHQRLPVVRAEAEHLPFAAASFDAAFIVALLDFVEDPVAVLAEARRVARGPVVVLALSANSYLAWRRRLAGWLGNRIFAAARFYSRKSLRAMAAEVDATVVAERAGLLLPPWLAARLGGLERRWAAGAPACAGLYAFAMVGRHSMRALDGSPSRAPYFPGGSRDPASSVPLIPLYHRKLSSSSRDLERDKTRGIMSSIDSPERGRGLSTLPVPKESGLPADDQAVPPRIKLALAGYLCAATLLTMGLLVLAWPEQGSTLLSEGEPAAKAGYEKAMLLVAALAGGVGASFHALHGYAYELGRRRLRFSSVAGYFARPLIGMGVALLVLVVLTALVVGGDITQLRPFGVAAACLLAGLFSKPAVQRLEALCAAIIESGPESEPITELRPQPPPESAGGSEEREAFGLLQRSEREP